jgi:hypothetical protein
MLWIYNLLEALQSWRDLNLHVQDISKRLELAANHPHANLEAYTLYIDLDIGEISTDYLAISPHSDDLFLSGPITPSKLPRNTQIRASISASSFL